MREFENRDYQSSMRPPHHTSLHKQTHPKALFIFAGILFAGTALMALIGFIAFRTPVTSDMLDISINTPDTVLVGELFDIDLELRNKEQMQLEDVNIRLIYPAGFSFMSAQPAAGNAHQNLWIIPTIKSQAKEKIRIKGVMLSDGKLPLEALVSYKIADIHSMFEKKVSRDVQSSGLDEKLTLTGPLTVSGGQMMEYRVAYTLPKEGLFEGVALTLPDGFTSSEVIPKADVGTSQWSFKSLLDHARDLRGEIVVKGVFASSSASQECVAEYILSKEKNLVIRKTITTSIESSLLSLELTKPQSISWSEPVTYTMTLRNGGTKVVENAEVVAMIEGEAIDRKLTDTALRARIQGSSYRWTKDVVPQLARIPAGGTVKVPVSLKLIGRDLRAQLTTRDISFTVSAIAQSEGGGSLSTELPLQKLTIPSDASMYIQTQALDESRKKISITLENSLSDVESLLLTATLPEAAEWLDEYTVSAGSLSFDPAADEAHWTLNRLPVGIPVTISFTVRASSADTISVRFSAQDPRASVPIVKKTSFSLAD
jgi:hypothetical protein